MLDLSPSGLSLPNRDYYIEEKFQEQRGWFTEHLTQVASLLSAQGSPVACSLVHACVP